MENNTENKKYDLIPRPAFMSGENNPKKGAFWIVEILEFFLLIIVYSFVQGFGAMFIASILFATVGRSSTTAMVSENLSLIFAILFNVFVWGMLVQKRKIASFGFVKENVGRSYLKGLLTGFVLLSLSLLISVATGSIKMTGISKDINIFAQLALFLSFCVQGMSEEVLCRGFFIPSFTRRYPVVIAVVLNSVFFAALHLMNPGIGMLPEVNLLLFGITASLYFIYTENIWGIGALHAMWNYVQGNLYGVKVSGIDMGDTIFTSESVAGKELINGGSFGLEGGLGVTIVYSAMIIILIVLMQKRRKNSSDMK